MINNRTMWEKLPSWLEGGIFSIPIAISSYYLIEFSHTLLRYLIKKIPGFFSLYYAPGYDFLDLFFAYIYPLIPIFVVGSIIGWFIGKKNKK